MSKKFTLDGTLDSNFLQQNGQAVVLQTRKINNHLLTADINMTKDDIGLNNVDNTSDLNKPISNLTQSALNNLQLDIDGKAISMSLDPNTYILTLKDVNNNVLSTVNLPLESTVIGATYDSVNKKVVLSLHNGQTLEIPVADMISPLIKDWEVIVDTGIVDVADNPISVLSIDKDNTNKSFSLKKAKVFIDFQVVTAGTYGIRVSNPNGSSWTSNYIAAGSINANCSSVDTSYGFHIDIEFNDLDQTRKLYTSRYNKTRRHEYGSSDASQFGFGYNGGAVDYGTRDITELQSASSTYFTGFRMWSTTADFEIKKYRLVIIGVRE